MDIKVGLTIDTLEKNYSLDILTPCINVCLQIVNRGGEFNKYLSNNITFFYYTLRTG